MALLLLLHQGKPSIGQTHHEEKDSKERFLSAGGGLAYGSGLKKGAINLRGYYNIGEAKLCFGPEFTLFQPAQVHGRELQLMEFAFIGHYIFHATPHLGLYPLGGPNLSIERFSGGHEKAETLYLWGLNAGAGIHLAYGRWAPYAEWKYVFGESEQQVVSVGLICNFL